MDTSVIRPTSHHPVIGHTVVGPAAPTVAEGKLREEFDKLRVECEVLETVLKERINALEVATQAKISFVDRTWRQHLTNTEDELGERLVALEARWYHAVRDWLKKVFRCQ